MYFECFFYFAVSFWFCIPTAFLLWLKSFPLRSCILYPYITGGDKWMQRLDYNFTFLQSSKPLCYIKAWHFKQFKLPKNEGNDWCLILHIFCCKKPSHYRNVIVYRILTCSIHARIYMVRTIVSMWKQLGFMKTQRKNEYQCGLPLTGSQACHLLAKTND